MIVTAIFRKKFICFLVASVAFTFNIAAQEAVNVVETDSTIVEEEKEPTVDGVVVKQRLEAIQKDIPLKYNQYVHGFIDFFTYRKPSFTKNMLERKNYFFPIFEKYLSEYNIPDEIKYLSMIESALNPKAISYAGASGLWQFMPSTGRIDFGLQVDKYIDERHHVVKSTIAACKYMRQLYRIFGDWELVLAAYNTGPGNVRRAIRKAGGGGFWDIYRFLHPQTRSYVPQYVAIVYMMHHAQDHNIFPEKDEVIPESTPVLVNNYLNLKTLASLANIPFEALQKVNPHVMKTELPDKTQNFELSIPNDYFAYFDQNKQMILDSASKLIKPEKKVKTEPNTILASTDDEEEDQLESPETMERLVKSKPKLKYHKVRKGENLSSIARKYHVKLYDLKAWNRIKRNNDLKYGSRLKIYQEGKLIKTEVAAKSKTKKNIQTVEHTEELAAIEQKSDEKNIKSDNKELKPATYQVKKGETLFSIATKHNVSMGDLREWNNIDEKGSVKIGQKLKLYEVNTRNAEPTVAQSEKKSKKNNLGDTQPRAKFHTVNKGDTIWSIAQMYEGLSVEKLRKLNGIKNNSIRKGQKLRLS